MTNLWRAVRLGEVLRHRKEFITIYNLTTYKRPRVQLHVQGIVQRDEGPGALIKTKTQQVCRTGEFLVAEIDGKVGGFGIVPESLNGPVNPHIYERQKDKGKGKAKTRQSPDTAQRRFSRHGREADKHEQRVAATKRTSAGDKRTKQSLLGFAVL